MADYEVGNQFTKYKPIDLLKPVNNIVTTLVDIFGNSRDVSDIGSVITDANGNQAILAEDNFKRWELPLQGTMAVIEREPSQGAAAGVLIGFDAIDSNTKKGYMKKHFSSKGYNSYAIAGIIGNLFAESKHDEGAIGDSGNAFGLAQWHPDRLKHLKEFAEKNGLNYKDFRTQVQFIPYELETYYPKVAEKLKKAKSIREATLIIMDDYERPKVWNYRNSLGKDKLLYIDELEKRIKFANQYGG